MRHLLAAAVACLMAAPAFAQAPYPPNQFRPYRGGVNCVQIADANGNFNCSALVTVDPATGVFSVRAGSTILTQVLGALVVAPASQQTALVSLGNDVVLVKQAYTTAAPTGPGAGGLTLRVRPSPVPGYCRVVVIAGNAFGAPMEFPMAFLDPSQTFPERPTGGPASSYGKYTVDLPGGPGGC